MIAVGVDNGADGAVVAIEGRKVHVAEIAPVIDIGRKTKSGKIGKKRIPDMHRMAAILHQIIEIANGPENVFAILERAQTFPGESPISALTYGRGWGAWEGMFAFAGVQYEIKDPKEWGIILKGVEGQDTKARAVLRVQRSLPSLNLVLPRHRTMHDGLADAACMALFGTALYNAQQVRP